MAPTPPAAAVTSSVPISSVAPSRRPRRSNNPSQAVREVSGSAAASAKESVPGFRPTMRSSTVWKRELVPGRSIAPA